jgi:hypothetical protein
MLQRTVGLAAGGLLALGLLQPGATEPEKPREPAELSWELAQVDDPASAELQKAVDRLYASISGPPGERDFAEFKSLFDEQGRLAAVAHGPNGDRIVRMTPDDWVERSGAWIATNGFFETEVCNRIEIFGHVAHVWSTYESRRTQETEPFARGINSIQLFKDPTDPNGAWRILTILWDSETDGHPIPDRYLHDD